MSLQITIGTAPCSWGVWWPDGTPSGTPYSVFLDQAAEAGYKTLELGPYGYLPTDSSLLKEELLKRNLSACGGTACLEFLSADSFGDVQDKVDRICALLKDLDVTYLMTMDGTPLTVEEKQSLGGRKAKTFDLFREMGNYCLDKYGVQVIMHPEKFSLIETKEELEELIARGLCICFDNGHYAAANGSCEHGDRSSLDFVKEYHDRIPYLHFKNFSCEIRRMELDGELSADDPRWDDLMCELEDGAIDYEAYRDLLDSLNYQGVAIIEQDCPNATADEAFVKAKKNLEYLKKIHMISGD